MSKHYIKVVGKGCNSGRTFEEDPLDVIQKWIKEGGVAFESRFVPWHMITEIIFTRNWEPPYSEPTQ